MAKNIYTIPVPREMLQRMDRSSSPAHIGKLRNAVDFVTPIGTPVLAAAEGIVTQINDDFYVGGPDASYWFFTNFITIRHSNGEFSRYDHLDYQSSKVKLNQKVLAGDEISKVGMTGYTYIPHLHFQVYVYTGYNIWTDFETIEIKDFKNILYSFLDKLGNSSCSRRRSDPSVILEFFLSINYYIKINSFFMMRCRVKYSEKDRIIHYVKKYYIAIS